MFAFLGSGEGKGKYNFLPRKSRKTVKLTKIAAFEKFVSPKNSREGGIQAGSRSTSYNTATHL